jgi:hypothetical protein
MNTFELKLVSETLDVSKGISILEVDTSEIPEDTKGIILSENTNEDRIILNQIYNGSGSSYILRTRVLKMPARKYNKGEVVAKLVSI